MVKQYLLASDFDQTLSFNDSGVALSELIGFHGFHDKVKGLAEMNLVQQGAELSYLILHDPDFRRVRRDHRRSDRSAQQRANRSDMTFWTPRWQRP